METDYELSFDRGRMQIDVIHGYLRRSYWSPGVRREIVERAMAGSTVIGVFERATGAQVGFARVISDFATFAYLSDVFVLEAHRGRGLSKRMVATLLADERFKTVRRWCLATADAHGLYQQFGFGPVDEGRWMELKMPVGAWAEDRRAT